MAWQVKHAYPTVLTIWARLILEVRKQSSKIEKQKY